MTRSGKGQTGNREEVSGERQASLRQGTGSGERQAPLRIGKKFLVKGRHTSGKGKPGGFMYSLTGACSNS